LPISNWHKPQREIGKRQSEAIANQKLLDVLTPSGHAQPQRHIGNRQ
jgi:hypothetical protein